MSEWKLKKDFGIRALLASITAIGFYASLGFIFAHFDLDLVTVLALVALAQAPFLIALTFYFTIRAMQRKE